LGAGRKISSRFDNANLSLHDMMSDVLVLIKTDLSATLQFEINSPTSQFDVGKQG
jgi:hypothetical protein